MSSFSIGLSALRANQIGLETVGQNIANSETPGYHRQAPEFVSVDAGSRSGVQVGLGVRVADIRQYRSELLEQAVTSNTFQSNSTTAELDDTRQIEAYLTPGNGGLDNLLETFFNQLQDLTSRPDDAALRRVALGGAVALTNGMNNLAANLDQLKGGVDGELRQAVGDVNSIASQIANLNEAVHRAEAQGLTAADQRDQRDKLVNDLAQLIDVRTIDQGGQITVLSGGVPLVVGSTVTPLQYGTDTSDNGIITVEGAKTAQVVTGGKLQGLLQVRNVTLPDFRGRLDTLAQELARRLDGVQATGLGLTGPLRFTTSNRPVTKVNVPLAQAGLALPPQAGTLYISVTDTAGQRSLHAVNIDPSTQSLQDVANAINGVGHLNAVVNAQSGTLQIVAATGYSFDFAGRLATQPTTTSFSDPTPPAAQATGTYTGAANDVYTYTVAGVTGPGPGVVGVTPGLTLNVTNSAGQTIASLNIGQGYSPGSDLPVSNGVQVHLGAGNLNNGDSFTTQVIAQPDTAGLLTALGMNTFFVGNAASDLKVRPELLTNPEQLAASRSGQPGDNTNLQRMVAARDAVGLANGTQTIGQFYAAMVGDVGTKVRELDQRQTDQQALGRSLAAQQQSVSGVDPNEELVQMLQYQRGFEAAARFINVVNDTLNQLFQTI